MKNSIKVERAKLNMTQQELSERIGVSRQTINSIEKAKYTPSVILALKISGVFDIKLEELFILEEGD